MPDRLTWPELLDLMESDLEARRVTDGWHKVSPREPLPSEFVARATAIVGRQAALVRDLEAERAQTAGERQALGRVPVMEREPVYLDVAG